MSGLDKLAVVSKVLMDQRVIELRQENERLRFESFWRDHSLKKLDKRLRWANSVEKIGPRCYCQDCLEVERFGRSIAFFRPWSGPCAFKPWFDRLLAQHEMTFVTLESDDLRPDCSLIDAHFVELDGNWTGKDYGGKLRGAKSADDPELRKLRRLFGAVEDVSRLQCVPC